MQFRLSVACYLLLVIPGDGIAGAGGPGELQLQLNQRLFLAEVVLHSIGYMSVWRRGDKLSVCAILTCIVMLWSPLLVHILTSLHDTP